MWNMQEVRDEKKSLKMYVKFLPWSAAKSQVQARFVNQNMSLCSLKSVHMHFKCRLFCIWKKKRQKHWLSVPTGCDWACGCVSPVFVYDGIEEPAVSPAGGEVVASQALVTLHHPLRPQQQLLFGCHVIRLTIYLDVGDLEEGRTNPRICKDM